MGELRCPTAHQQLNIFVAHIQRHAGLPVEKFLRIRDFLTNQVPKHNPTGLE